jgi:hypothetical protein
VCFFAQKRGLLLRYDNDDGPRLTCGLTEQHPQKTNNPQDTPSHCQSHHPKSGGLFPAHIYASRVVRASLIHQLLEVSFSRMTRSAYIATPAPLLSCDDDEWTPDTYVRREMPFRRRDFVRTANAPENIVCQRRTGIFAFSKILHFRKLLRSVTFPIALTYLDVIQT